MLSNLARSGRIRFGLFCARWSQYQRHLAASCEVIGYADSPLARSLLGRFKNLPHVSVQQARIYAVDFISQAKKYDGQYVGGDINLYSIEDHDCEIWPRGTSGIAIIRECKYTRMITSGMDEWEREIGQLTSALDQYFFGNYILNSLSHRATMARVGGRRNRTPIRALPNSYMCNMTHWRGNICTYRVHLESDRRLDRGHEKI